MLQDLVNATLMANPVSWVFLEQLDDQISEVVRMRHANLVWYLEWIVDDLFILSVPVPVVEGKHASKHMVHDNAYSPVVGCLIVELSFELLRCEVCRCANERVGEFVTPEDPGNAEINYLEVAVRVNHQVLQFEVPVHDVTVVEFFETQEKLSHEKLGPFLTKLFLLLEDNAHLTTSNEGHDKVKSLLSRVKVLHAGQELVICLNE